jgi:hypothetical protein
VFTPDQCRSDGDRRRMANRADLLDRGGQTRPAVVVAAVEKWAMLLVHFSTAGSSIAKDLEESPDQFYRKTIAQSLSYFGQDYYYDSLEYSASTKSYIPLRYLTKHYC